jgi:predicted ATPase
LLERRQQLHRRTGLALEALYSSAIEEHLAELAHHYARSANLDKAIAYLVRAAQQAIQRSAGTEAIDQLMSALRILKACQRVRNAMSRS